MAYSKTDICNMALGHIGIGFEIANVDTEASEEAAACRRFYTIARESCLGDFAWSFASKIAALSLIEKNPNDEWRFSYRYPSDCLFVRRILSGTRNDTRQTRIPYKISHDDAGLVIFTDKENAKCEYTVNITDTTKFSHNFVIALSYLLASLIAPNLTKGDQFRLGDKAQKNYIYALSAAAADNANEEQPDEPPDSEFTLARI